MKFPFVSRRTAEKQASYAFKEGHRRCSGEYEQEALNNWSGAFASAAGKQMSIVEGDEVAGCVLIDLLGRPLAVKTCESTGQVSKGDVINFEITI